MKRDKLTLLLLSLLMVFFLAAPHTGFALSVLTDPDTQEVVDSLTYDYDFSAVYGGTEYRFDYAKITIEVHDLSYTGAYSDEIDVTLGEGEFLYVYEITNEDVVSSFPEIVSLSLGVSAEAVVDRGGSLSGDADFSISGERMLISGLSIESGASDVVYYVSDHAPLELRSSYITGALGASLSVEIPSPNCFWWIWYRYWCWWRPPPPDNDVPEPTSLLLIGSGLIGLAGIRRMTRVR